MELAPLIPALVILAFPTAVHLTLNAIEYVAVWPLRHKRRKTERELRRLQAEIATLNAQHN
jgi:type II secretory pathway component PulM